MQILGSILLRRNNPGAVNFTDGLHLDPERDSFPQCPAGMFLLVDIILKIPSRVLRLEKVVVQILLWRTRHGDIGEPGGTHGPLCPEVIV